LRHFPAVRGARQLHLDGRLRDHARRHHEDDEQDERDVDERRDVDSVDPFGGIIRGGGHGYSTSLTTCMPEATACASALDLPTTRFKSRWKTLNASTAGMATKSPTAVATSASEMPAITVCAPLLLETAR